MVTIDSTILSGVGAIPSLASLLPDIRKMLLVADRNIAQFDGVQQVRALLEKHYLQVNVIDNVPAKSVHHDVRQLMDALGDASFDVVVGISGGSVLDVAKLLSILYHPQSPGLDALLAGEKPTQRMQSWLIPTTAGTDSEATPNAILAIPGQGTRVGIISQVLSPDYVALFPELTTSIPAHIMASTGIDAPCHLLECFIVTVANPVSNDATLTGSSKLFRHIQPVVNDPQDLRAKLEVLWTSYCGGVAMTHVGTHLVHALSYPLGDKYHLPYGVTSAILLASCMAFVRPWAVEKLVRVWDYIPDTETALNVEEKSHALVTWLQTLVNQLKLPDNLVDLGVPPEDTTPLSRAALNVKRFIDNVPYQLDLQDVQAICQIPFLQHQFKE